MSKSMKQLLAERGLSVAEFMTLAGCSRRQAQYYLSGEKKLSKLERLGLESLPKVAGN